jgi:hypothetical protein
MSGEFLNKSGNFGKRKEESGVRRDQGGDRVPTCKRDEEKENHQAADG